MGKSEEMLRLERDLDEQPEMREKLEAEIKRIAETKEAECDGEAMVKAAAALGYTITLEELERAAADLEKLDDDELETAGGVSYETVDDRKSVNYSKGCNKAQKTFIRAKNSKDEKGRDGCCTYDWHCGMAFKHSNSKSKDTYCWGDYLCEIINKFV
ncbi:MAG: hypothetical protein IKH57_18685 [Clostridia bacterium]|nr:hypothetical protein [Clostridia bacterium]